MATLILNMMHKNKKNEQTVNEFCKKLDIMFNTVQ